MKRTKWTLLQLTQLDSPRGLGVSRQQCSVPPTVYLWASPSLVRDQPLWHPRHWDAIGFHLAMIRSGTRSSHDKNLVTLMMVPCSWENCNFSTWLFIVEMCSSMVSLSLSKWHQSSLYDSSLQCHWVLLQTFVSFRSLSDKHGVLSNRLSFHPIMKWVFPAFLHSLRYSWIILFWLIVLFLKKKRLSYLLVLH